MSGSDRTPELLAPAGGWRALRAAVASGADAVYLGLERLNARRGAENFTLETLEDACRFAHLRGVKVYLAANVIVLLAEFREALQLIADAWAAGVDAVIVQDIGLLRALAQTMPDVRLHASTQLNAHSTSTVLALAELGVRRVTLARETTLDEVAAITAAAATADVEVETFVHGALCVCYSGQCLMSSVIGGRSANRGLCAQPCRLAYSLIDEHGQALETQGAHLLSPKDLAGIGLLPELVGAGVASLKIEGRMKSPEYVALVTGTYRAALDRAVTAPGRFEVRDGEVAVLAEAFNRGFSEAYFVGERGNAMMSYGRPNNRGVPVGRIIRVSGQTATVALDTSLARDDTIEIWTGRGRFAQRAEGLAAGGERIDAAPAGARVTLELCEPAVAGDRVFRVRNAALADAARRACDESAARVPVDIAVKVELGAPLAVELTGPSGRTGRAQGHAVEPARTKPVEVSEVIEHVGRLGGTPFRANDFDVSLTPGAGVSFSELHRVRRAAVEALEDAILSPWSGRRRVSSEWHVVERAPRASKVEIVAVVGDAESVQAALSAGADRVHLEGFDVGIDWAPSVAAQLPRVCHDSEEPDVLQSACEAGAAVVATLGQLRALAGHGVRLEAHWSLNAANPAAVDALAERGVELVWLSPELSREQIAMIARSTGTAVGIAVAGRQEVMVTEHCVLMALGECGRTCEECARRRGAWSLRDRKGFEFPVRVDRSGRSHVYNAVPLDLTRAIDEAVATGIAAVRIDGVTEGAEWVAERVVAVRRALDRPRRHDAPQRRRGAGSTSGHFFRGVE